MCILRIFASSKIPNLLQTELNLSLICVHMCTYTSPNSSSLRSFQPENHHNDVHNRIYIWYIRIMKGSTPITEISLARPSTLH